MDVVFSNYKHDFLGKGQNNRDQDFTCDFEGLAKFYKDYRRKMELWETLLPGRVINIRYEDLVNDLPGIARAIVRAANLEWKDEILNFHNKKHAVNTYR